jgi:hypothetical protein
MILSVVSVLVVCVAVAAFVVIVMMRRESGGESFPDTSTQEVQEEAQDIREPPSPSPPLVASPVEANPSDAEGIETKLTEIPFEPLLMPGYAPDASAVVKKKTDGYPPFKLVSCTGNGYAIRWMGRYLTVRTSDDVRWELERMEPQSCFKIRPGYCVVDGRSGDYVMFQSHLNKQFLRVDGDTKKIICADGPTESTTPQFCWKFIDDTPKRMPCGPQFLPEYGRVVDVPCSINYGEPDCAAATPGFKSACCLRHPEDPSCRGSVFREVVGRSVDEASLYLKTRLPRSTKLRLCPSGAACERIMQPTFANFDADTVVIPYDKRLGVVTYPAYRYI